MLVVYRLGTVPAFLAFLSGPSSAPWVSELRAGVEGRGGVEEGRPGKCGHGCGAPTAGSMPRGYSLLARRAAAKIKLKAKHF